MSRFIGLALIFLLGSARALADTSVAAQLPSHDARAATRRTFFVDGVAFKLTAWPVARRGRQLVQLEVEARSADGAEHFMADDPIELNGSALCVGSDGSGSGSGFGEGRGGSDGWSTATRVAPHESARWSRLLPESEGVARGCELQLDMSLASFAHKDGTSNRLELARIVLGVCKRGGVHVVIGEPVVEK